MLRLAPVSRMMLGAWALLGACGSDAGEDEDPSNASGAELAGRDSDAPDAGAEPPPVVAQPIWNEGSAAIDFELRGNVAQHLCGHHAGRDELTAEQLEGLSALRLHDADGSRAGACDVPHYMIAIHTEGGSSMTFWAMESVCGSGPIVLIDEFEAWAQSTPCSLSQQRP